MMIVSCEIHTPGGFHCRYWCRSWPGCFPDSKDFSMDDMAFSLTESSRMRIRAIIARVEQSDKSECSSQNLAACFTSETVDFSRPHSSATISMCSRQYCVLIQGCPFVPLLSAGGHEWPPIHSD